MVQFNFKENQYRYVELVTSYLYVRMKIEKASGTDFDASANVGFVNNVFDSFYQEM